MIRGDRELREIERNRPKPGEVRTDRIDMFRVRDAMIEAGYIPQGDLISHDRVDWTHKITGARAVTERVWPKHAAAVLKSAQGVEFVWDAQRRKWLARPCPRQP